MARPGDVEPGALGAFTTRSRARLRAVASCASDREPDRCRLHRHFDPHRNSGRGVQLCAMRESRSIGVLADDIRAFRARYLLVD